MSYEVSRVMQGRWGNPVGMIFIFAGDLSSTDSGVLMSRFATS